MDGVQVKHDQLGVCNYQSWGWAFASHYTSYPSLVCLCLKFYIRKSLRERERERAMKKR